MGRPNNPDLTKYWKICLPATLAGTVELYLLDAIHKKPKYGARAELISGLLSRWVHEQQDPNYLTEDKLLQQLKDLTTTITSNPDFTTEALKAMVIKLENQRARA